MPRLLEQLPSATAYRYIDKLEEQGYLETVRLGRGAPVNVALTDEARKLLQPHRLFRGEIVAGDPLEGEEYRLSLLRIHDLADIFPEARDGDYLLTVIGESMTGAGIYPGQYALLRPGLPPQNGNICAVWVKSEGGGTLKRIFFEENAIRLVPENPDFEERTYPLEDVVIQGVLLSTLAVKRFDA